MKSELDDFFLADNNLQKLEDAHRLLHDCMTKASDQLHSQLVRVMHDVARATDNRWKVWDAKDSSYFWVGLVPTDTGRKQDPGLHIASMRKNFLSKDAWVGVWTDSPQSRRTNALVTACKSVLGEKSLAIEPGYPYWVKIPGWPDVSLEPHDFSIAGLERLLRKPKMLPTWATNTFKQILDLTDRS